MAKDKCAGEWSGGSLKTGQFGLDLVFAESRRAMELVKAKYDYSIRLCATAFHIPSSSLPVLVVFAVFISCQATPEAFIEMAFTRISLDT